MLTLFDALAEALPDDGVGPVIENVEQIVGCLEKAVQETTELLPKLKLAGVVDAGALGMYIFFEGFFYALAGVVDAYRPLADVFRNRLQIASSFREGPETGYCVDFVVEGNNISRSALTEITRDQSSVVVIPDGNLYKVHFHTQNREKAKTDISRLGGMVNWEDDDLQEQVAEFMSVRSRLKLHIMTDAAGSVTLHDARKLGITLLNSYINLGERCLPETHLQPAALYRAMRQGIKASTSQASVFERHQCYESVLCRFEKVLYLCVGSVFTGNYHVALEWKKRHDPQNRMVVVDTGAASGRLAAIVFGTVRFLASCDDGERTINFARQAVQQCEEYVFLDKLQYLAAGGRLSKTSAFFGDMLKMKPVVSPQPEGAKKIGVVRNREEQVKMACEKLAATLQKNSRALILLEYSDNYDWLNDQVRGIIAGNYSQAEIILQPLSLTSGVHMGPGTWALAFLPEIQNP